MSNGQAGKGDTFRKVDGAKYRENYDRIFGRKDMAATNNNTGEGQVFGDIDKHQMIQGICNRLRRVLETLQKVLADDHAFVRAAQGFIPHLKRTDKDRGSLPLYSQTYNSKKTNRNHCVLCVISRVVQDYWDLADDTITPDKEQLLLVKLGLLETFAAKGFDNYRVTGNLEGGFYLDTIDNIEAALADKDNAAEIDANEQAEFEAKGEINPDPTEGSPVSEESNSTDAEGETDEDKNVDVSSEQPEDKNVDVSSEQLSTELADSCAGDCNTCESHACDTDEAKGIPEVPEEELDEQAAVAHETGQDQVEVIDAIDLDDDDLDQEVAKAEETEAERQQGQDDDNVQYPDQGPLMDDGK
ncbi:MAG: hypothetical protein FVQ80_11260 [Planctomycetes bacterium]|nr:hypothetical protein [Planctomycetota bacterium]